MDFVNDIKDACDSIEERVYNINKILEQEENNEATLQFMEIVNLVKKIKENVNEKNATELRDELIKIQNEMDSLFDSVKPVSRV